MVVLAAVGVLLIVIDVRVYLVVVDAPRIVEIGLPAHPRVAYLPTVLQPHRPRNTLIVLQCIRRVVFGIEIIQSHVEDGTISVISTFC